MLRVSLCSVMGSYAFEFESQTKSIPKHAAAARAMGIFRCFVLLSVFPTLKGRMCVCGGSGLVVPDLHGPVVRARDDVGLVALDVSSDSTALCVNKQ